MIARPLIFLLTVGALSACAVTPETSEDFPAAQWQPNLRTDAPYLLAPGDTLQLTVYSAPELSRETITVAPDGRIRLPLIAPIMATARTPESVAGQVRAAYSEQLRRPDIDLLVTGHMSQKIFVGGEVETPGVFDLPGAIDPLQAVIMAGGTTNLANPREAFILRRMPGGEVKTAVFDLNAGISDPNLADWGPLVRFDVVYVPRSRIANQNLFVEQFIRQALPIEFSLFYDISGNNNR